jgi:hypothetical protein
VELFECLDAVEGDAAGALDRDRQPVLFDRLSWYRLLQRHCPPPGRLLVARAQDSAGNRSWLFLAVQGRRAIAYANWYTLAFNGVFDIGDDEGSWHLDNAIAAALRKRGITTVDLYPMLVPDPYRVVFAPNGWWSFARTESANWIADVAGLTFADYWAKRPAKLRNTAERKARGTELEVHILSHFDAAAWSEYEAVYAASWKPEEGSTAFLRALAEQEGAAATLRLGIARKDGRAVAAQFWLVENGRATIHKLAYSEEAKSLSPGTLLSMAMFRHAIDVDLVGLIDFGLGDDPYKADWMDRKQPVGRMLAYHKTSLSGTGAAARELVRRLRSD